MNKNPLISIIIPVYNAETYLERCINSIFAQSYFDWELILVDDGSTDASASICDIYQKKDTRVRVFHQKNGGAGCARNMGLSQSKGYYITFIDSDDYVTSDYLNCFIKDITHSQGADLYIQGHETIYPSGQIEVTIPPRLKCSIKEKENNLFQVVRLTQYAGPTAKLFKRDIIENNLIRFNEELIVSEDYNFLLRYLMFCKTVYLSNIANYIYDHHLNSLSSDLHSFDQEYYAFYVTCTTISDFKEKVKIDTNIGMGSYLMERALSANYKSGLKRKDRLMNLRKFSDIHLLNYNYNHHPSTLYLSLLKFLIVHKLYVLFDFFANLRLSK